MRRVSLLLVLFAALAFAADAPKMKAGDVKEVAPGVFFRYSAISPTDPKVFGGSNNIWIVFEDYVVVIDANFPKEAEDVLAAIKKTTKKPVRYVLDTHHHGDHSWGNAVWVKAGATIVSSANCAKLMKKNGLAEFLAAGKGPGARKDVAASTYKGPTLVFDEKLVLDDGKQRIEFYQLGHSHTIGDAVAYLPKHKILCTGDACVNGPYNYMGQSDSASWIRCLEKMEQFDVKLVLPGHGLPEGKGLLGKQKRYFQDLRRDVKTSIGAGKDIEDIIKAYDLPWYKEWTTVKPAADNIRHVYNEYMGLVAPWDFDLDFGILEGPSPTKDDKGWTKPKRIVIPSALSADQLAGLKRAAPEVEFLPAKTPADAAKLAVNADAVIGFVTAEVVKANKNKSLRWVQSLTGGVTDEAQTALRGSKITLTDMRRADAPNTADQTFVLLLALTRNLLGKAKTPPAELRGKNVLVLGFGGTGEQIARRAHAFGARVSVLDDAVTEKPTFVFSLEALDKLDSRLKEADVVVLALPLGEKTRGILDEKRLKSMKKTALIVNALHPELIDLKALAEALESKKITGAALDTTATAGLKDHALTKLSNAVLTRSEGKPSPEAEERRWRLLRENVRRFAAGERLLGVVDY